MSTILHSRFSNDSKSATRVLSEKPEQKAKLFWKSSAPSDLSKLYSSLHQEKQKTHRKSMPNSDSSPPIKRKFSPTQKLIRHNSSNILNPIFLSNRDSFQRHLVAPISERVWAQVSEIPNKCTYSLDMPKKDFFSASVSSLLIPKAKISSPRLVSIELEDKSERFKRKIINSNVVSYLVSESKIRPLSSSLKYQSKGDLIKEDMKKFVKKTSAVKNSERGYSREPNKGQKIKDIKLSDMKNPMEPYIEYIIQKRESLY
ncbi:unnamed protein product [Blepharisma stoltei]|uniref:Uncharacterized protein n=1 Tax=Blepharisma stoltei TaxID=1481888 RepID=A0AAU9K8U8_9CILI|nr:unnamed protein product [Blepharisma stoltei]